MKTEDLIGVGLDWAVATAMKCPPPYFDDKGMAASLSTDWSRGGSIIDRERIMTEPQWIYNEQGVPSVRWRAQILPYAGCAVAEFCYGATPLIAAMRCFVTAKLGKDVNPEVLE
jgi:hypothetical protein